MFLNWVHLFFQGLNFLLNVFLRLTHVAYRFYWFMFHCVRIYISFLLLTDICFDILLRQTVILCPFPGRWCAASQDTPQGGGLDPGVCAPSVWLNGVTPGSFQSGSPGLQFKWQFCLLHFLQTVVVSDVSFLLICWKLSDSSYDFGLHLHGY